MILQGAAIIFKLEKFNRMMYTTNHRIKQGKKGGRLATPFFLVKNERRIRGLDNPVHSHQAKPVGVWV